MAMTKARVPAISGVRVGIVALGFASAACSGGAASDPLMQHYVAHRGAIERNDFSWIAGHLSRKFMLAHVSDMLAAETSNQLDNERETLIDQATFMKDDIAICSARSRYENVGGNGTLELVVKRRSGDTRKVNYDFVRDDDRWLLDSIQLLSVTSPGHDKLSCEQPILQFP